ncbi:single-stranded-DNA-specific exonuclease RecJ [Desulfobaculum bizertense]|uniref:Single-stranded-DNA-specific exonuclease RecJ n=1 Tax=Desulfobaculum bizertense DSM 18034 TaxID=1121442 RepID=A0A1T4WFX8_9BACT|nr:single-stranded-DNA-specific exonuclease RecJ [Desulfobaculum bizertense]SKA76234.1 exonuclease RecJ [Desulfobaculum bizertense DSM 18034]
MSLNWIPRPQEKETPADIERRAEALHVSPRIATILWQRGMHTAEQMDTFMSPGLKHLAPLSEYPGLNEAAQILADGLLAGKKFAVWGDYDVDGVTSTALVTDVLAEKNIDSMHHLPDRFSEGYGLNCAGIEALAEQGVELLLTVDCGITNIQEVTRAKELGMTVVVSDHHLPGKELPPADAIVDPRCADCPCADLAGVGVAFMLMAAVNALVPPKVDIRKFLDFVALGTIADVVKLRGQNRVLVKNGLLLLGEAKRPGIAALKEVSKYAPTAALGAGQVGFGLAPRINAAGRIGKAEDALTLLLSKNYSTARPIAAQLDDLNTERRATEDSILQEALTQAESQSKNRLGLVLYHPDWHAGVIGIVASRIVEAFYRPTLILTKEGDHLKGSGRSTHEFHLYDGLTECSELLLGFGGHKQAAGMSLDENKLPALRDAFDKAVRKQCGDSPLTATLLTDGELPFAEIDFTLLKELELLQPFGPGNAEPVFVSPPVKVERRSVFGKNHIKLDLLDEQSGIRQSAKAWRQAENILPGIQGRSIRIAFTPRIDRYRGTARIDLYIKDWKEI